MSDINLLSRLVEEKIEQTTVDLRRFSRFVKTALKTLDEAIAAAAAESAPQTHAALVEGARVLSGIIFNEEA